MAKTFNTEHGHNKTGANSIFGLLGKDIFSFDITVYFKGGKICVKKKKKIVYSRLYHEYITFSIVGKSKNI